MLGSYNPLLIIVIICTVNLPQIKQTNKLIQTYTNQSSSCYQQLQDAAVGLDGVELHQPLQLAGVGLNLHQPIQWLLLVMFT